MTASSFDSATENAATAPWRHGSGWHGEFLRYLTASALALALDTGLFTLLIVAGFSWPVAAAAGFCLGLAAAYLLSVRLVFAHRAVPDRRREFVLFAGIGLFGLLLTELSLWLWIEGLQVAALPAKLATAGVVFLSNFGLRKALLFTPRGGQAR